MEPLINESKVEHYNLRWNNYSNNLIQVFSEHQCEEKLVDVTLICEGQYVKAHKLVLSACSVFFQDMFKNYGNVIHPFIILSGIKFNHLKHIIEFIYQGEIKVSDSDLEGVLTLGENLQVKGLSSVKLKEKIAEPSDGIKFKKTADSNQPMQIPITSNATTGIQEQDEALTNKEKTVVTSPFKSENFSDSVPEIIKKNSSTNFSINESTEPEKKRLKKLPIFKDRPFDEDNKHTESKGSINDFHRSIEKIESIPQFLFVPEETIKLEERIPRPANAFMIFADEWRKKLAVEYPGDNNKNISVRLGNLWKSLNSEGRESYYAAARRAQVQHQNKYPC